MTRTPAETDAQVLDVLATPRPARPASPATVAHRVRRLLEATEALALALDSGATLAELDALSVRNAARLLDRRSTVNLDALRDAEIDAAAAVLAEMVA